MTIDNGQAFELIAYREHVDEASTCEHWLCGLQLTAAPASAARIDCVLLQQFAVYESVLVASSIYLTSPAVGALVQALQRNDPSASTPAICWHAGSALLLTTSCAARIQLFCVSVHTSCCKFVIGEYCSNVNSGAAKRVLIDITRS